MNKKTALTLYGLLNERESLKAKRDFKGFMGSLTKTEYRQIQRRIGAINKEVEEL